mmetsp:Transcript_103986/g.155736  ORF Transcript_103986/g.155736 Transcript_103986/m.155736 type:complete len:117 (-) Transcript_103986:508-858(-)
MAAAVSDEIDPTVLLDYECIKLPSHDDPDSNREPLDQKCKLRNDTCQTCNYPMNDAASIPGHSNGPALLSANHLNILTQFLNNITGTVVVHNNDKSSDSPTLSHVLHRLPCFHISC